MTVVRSAASDRRSATVDSRLSPDGRTLILRVPMTFARRGGRKLVVSPDGTPSPDRGPGQAWTAPRPRVDSTLVKALARAFRWRRLLETGTYTTVDEIAATETINTSYVSRILRLTLLAPDIVGLILDGRQPPGLTAAALMKPFPVEWKAQRREFGTSPSAANLAK